MDSTPQVLSHIHTDSSFQMRCTKAHSNLLRIIMGTTEAIRFTQANLTTTHLKTPQTIILFPRLIPTIHRSTQVPHHSISITLHLKV